MVKKLSTLHISELPKGTKVLFRNSSEYVDIKSVSRNIDESLIEKVKSRAGKPIDIKFPINFKDKEWASLVGAILSEGSIMSRSGVGFWNKNTEFFQKYVKLISSIVQEGIEVREKIYGCFLPTIFTKILIYGLKMPTGDKVLNDIGIPEVYLECNDENFIGCLLSWLFTGDGWITVFKDHLGQKHRVIGIGFGSKEKDLQPKLLKDTIKLLNKMKIKTNKPVQEIKETEKGKITYNWKLFIRGKRNLTIFKEKINFQKKSQQILLSEAIQSFVRPKSQDNESLFVVIETVQALSNEKRFATKHEIAQLTDFRIKWIERLLKRAVVENRLKIIGGGNRKESGYGKYPYRYVAI